MRAAVAVLVTLLMVIGGLTAYTAAYVTPRVPPPPAVIGHPRVKLAVLVVFDQMAAHYLEKWQPYFGKGGFARLQTDGAWFTNCYYPYGTTSTGPGHASMLTGTSPDRHGIINNEWFDPAVPGDVYCAGMTRYSSVPGSLETSSGESKKPKTAGTPERLRSETVADVLRRAYGDRSRVYGLSLKDRSAILPCGQTPNGAFWFEGRFVTSTYYADQLPGWVAEFNASGKAEEWFGKPWDRVNPGLDYAALSGPDIVTGEGRGVTVPGKGAGTGWSQGVAFPHPNTGGVSTPGRTYYESVANSPAGNDLLLALAKSCVTAEKLGTHPAPDLLVISFSSNDLIGHTWGPDSQEVMDVTLRSDAVMADLLSFLDREVGDGEYVVAVTADHGVCPLPEVSASRGIDARRVDPKVMEDGLRAELNRRFGAGKWVESFLPPWIHIDHALAARKNIPVIEVTRAAASYLSAQPRVYRTYTRETLNRPNPDADVIDRRVRRSYMPELCGDLYVVLKPYDLFSKPGTTGTSHGTPHDYDCHVPLLVYGPGIAGGPRSEAVTPQAPAAIFAHYLGLRPPGDCEYPVPVTLGR